MELFQRPLPLFQKLFTKDLFLVIFEHFLHSPCYKRNTDNLNAQLQEIRNNHEHQTIVLIVAHMW